MKSRKLTNVAVPGEQHFGPVHYVADTQSVGGFKPVGNAVADDEHVTLAYYAAFTVNDMFRAAVQDCHKLIKIIVPVDEKRNIVPPELYEQREAVVVREVTQLHVLHALTPSI